MAALSAIYTGIRNKLTGTSAVTALVGQRIVSLFSRGTVASYPYLAMGMITESEPSESGLRTQRWQFTACAGSLGMAAAQDVLEAVKGALDMGSLTITGWTVYETRLISTRTSGGGADSEYCWAHADYYIVMKPA